MDFTSRSSDGPAEPITANSSDNPMSLGEALARWRAEHGDESFRNPFVLPACERPYTRAEHYTRFPLTLLDEQRRAFERRQTQYAQHSSAAFPFLVQQYGDEQRVSTDNRCPICGREKWCLTYGLRECLAAVLCMRDSTSSQLRTIGRKISYFDGDGWLHELPGAFPLAQRPAGYDTSRTGTPRRVGQRPTRSFDEWQRLQAQFVAALAAASGAIEHWAASLGLPAHALADFSVGWHGEKRAYSAPMTGVAGEIIGIHLRDADGFKFAVAGSHNGLFLPERLYSKTSLSDFGGRLLIVEGLTDAVALSGWGFAAAGRCGCDGGRQLVLQLARRLKPRELFIVSENDENGRGQQGAARLAEELAKCVAAPSIRVIQPPASIKDVRAWLLAGGTAADMESLLSRVPDSRVTVLPK